MWRPVGGLVAVDEPEARLAGPVVSVERDAPAVSELLKALASSHLRSEPRILLELAGQPQRGSRCLTVTFGQLHEVPVRAWQPRTW